MTESTSERIEKALQSFAPGAKLLRTWTLAGGISADMTAFEAQMPDGETRRMIARRPSVYKFRTDPDVAASEMELLNALCTAGLPVQRAHYVEPFIEGAPQPFFILDYIEGKPEVGPRDPSDFIRRFAEQLALIHRVDYRHLPSLPAQDAGFTPGMIAPEGELRETEVRAALEGHEPITGPNKPVLRHGDFWPGNILWREDEIVGVIDWEEALVGEPLADLGICRLDIWWILGEDASNEFTDRYLSLVDLDSSEQPYWDLCASLRPIRNIEEWAPAYTDLGRPDITVETMKRDHRAFVERALSRI